MTFGTDLKDQVPSILDYLGQGITSLTQFRAFIKEKSQIEREYAQKLENLTKKYKPNKSVQKDDWNFDDTTEGTTSAVWTQLLEQTSFIAKNRLGVADQMHQTIADSLRDMVSRKEESRKKHTSFYHKLKHERDKTFSEKDKAKQLYDDACSEIESLKTKLNKTNDQEKVQKQLEAAYLERDNKKNMYLLAMSVANSERAKYFDQDLPVLANQLEELDAERTECLQYVLRQYVTIESNSSTIVKQCHSDTLKYVDKLDPAIETSRFTQRALDLDSTERAANITFTFMPWNGGANASETIIDRDDHLVTNDAAVIFLNNKLLKDRKRLDLLTEEVSQKSMEASQLESEVMSMQSKETAEYDKSKEKWLDLLRDLTLTSTEQAKVKSEVDLIIQHIGDDGLRAKNHDFKASSFTIPTTCDYCSSTIWGLSNKGFTCRDCGFNCHGKCEMKVAPNCSKVKGQINPQPTALSRSQSKSTFHDPSFITSPSFLESPSLAAPQSSLHIPTQSLHMPPSPVISVASPPHEALTDDIRCIYSYDAQNQDELSVKEGDTLATIEPDDGSGWIKARRGQYIGLVPATYIESLSKTVTAIYDYEATNPEELELREGDVITVIKKDDSGWWEGKLNERIGIFPANYVQ